MEQLDERNPADFDLYDFDEGGDNPTGSCAVCGTDTYGDEKLCDECSPAAEGKGVPNG